MKGIKIIPKQPGATAWINQKELIEKVPYGNENKIRLLRAK